MGIEKVTQQQRFTSDNVIVGADSNPLDTGLSVYGKITNTERISSRGEIYTDRNLIATGNISATDASFTGFLYVTGGIVAPGLTTDVSPDKIKTTGAKLNDVLKVTENAGVTAYAPSRVNVEELSSTAISLLDGATINYDGNNQTFVVKNPEEAIVYESSYIKQLAKSTCGDLTNPGYAAITNDSRVIAWGHLPQNIFGSTAVVSPYENIRVPFWAEYDGRTGGGDFRPYGGDILDTLSGTSIVDLYWSNNCAMALLSSSNDSIDGTVWVAGSNVAGWGVQSAQNPQSVVKNKFGGLFILNTMTTNTSATVGGAKGNTGLNLLNAEKDICGIQKYSSTPQQDIIIDKTNSPELSSDSFYYVSLLPNANNSNASIRRINHYGELVSSHSYAATTAGHQLLSAAGIAMVSGDNGKNLLYVCDTARNQRKIKIFDITNIAAGVTPYTTTEMILVTAIGTGTQNHTDGDTDGPVAPTFHTLKRIVIDPTNHRIAYVTDQHRIKRIWRKDNGHYKVRTISNENPGDETGIFSAASGAAVARFTDPFGIAISNNGKNLYIADTTTKKIQKVTITTNEENNFDGISEYYVNTNVDQLAQFNFPKGITKDNNGNIYIADSSNNVIRKIIYDNVNKSYGKVTTIAGRPTGPGIATAAANIQSTIGKLSAVRFNDPRGIAFSPSENSLYVTNKGTHSISKISLDPALSALSAVSAIGTTGGVLSGEGLSGRSAQFWNPINLCYGERSGNKYIWVVNNNESTNSWHYIKQIEIQANHNYKITNLTKTWGAYSATTTPLTTNYPAISALLHNPRAIVYDSTSDSLYFSNKGTSIQKIKFLDNKIYTVAGAATASNLAGPALDARFRDISGLAISGTDMFVVDGGNKKIWRIENFSSDISSNRIVSEYIGTGGAANTKDTNGYGAQIKFSSPSFMLSGNDNDFIISTSNLIKRLYKNEDDNIYLETINGTTANSYVNTITTTLNWEPCGLFIDEEDKLFYTEKVADQVGYIYNKILYPYLNMSAGGIGIGAGYNKSTCGFIKVVAKDQDGNEPKFKSIKMVSDKGRSSSRFTAIFGALDTEDSLWLWGYSPDGAFGNGFINEMGPTKIYQFEKNVKDFAINCATSQGSGRTLISIITKDNKLFTAGDNSDGQLGRGNPALVDESFKIFRQCKKDSADVNDADKLIDSISIGYKNNLYISTLSTVWACGDHAIGILGRGTIGAKDPYFKEVDILTNVKQIVGTLNSTYGFVSGNVFALKDDGTLYAWGNNFNGVCLVNNNSDSIIYTPTACYNFEERDVVKNAKIVITNKDPLSGQFKITYLDKDNNLYIGGYKTEAELPTLPQYIPYFRKFNMKNIMSDVCLVNENAIFRKSNGTVYTVNSFGAKKVF